MQKRGFSLIEILLVVSLSAGLALVSFMCLSNGLKLWKKSSEIIAEEDCLVFFDQWTQDLRNSFQISQMSFQADEFSLSFPTMVLMDFDRRSIHASLYDGWQMGKVSYVFDIQQQAVIRKQASYAQSLKNQWGQERIVLSQVQEMKIRYFFPQQEQAFSFLKEGEMPQAIEVQVKMKSKKTTYQKQKSILVEDGAWDKQWTRMIIIPSVI